MLIKVFWILYICFTMFVLFESFTIRKVSEDKTDCLLVGIPYICSFRNYILLGTSIMGWHWLSSVLFHFYLDRKSIRFCPIHAKTYK